MSRTRCKTPLSVIAGRAEQLASRPDSDDRARRAVEVIRGFLRLARGDVPALDRIRPETTIRAAASLVEHRFGKAGVSLAVEVEASLPPIRGDERLLEQALVNLMLNACDACIRGGHVVVRGESDRDAVNLVVSDDGAGISAADAARVLEPFFSTKAADEGTGIGLAIAKEIVSIHRGTLTLSPRSPRGTVATIRVPIESEAVDART